jgi:hypothetical protein
VVENFDWTSIPVMDVDGETAAITIKQEEYDLLLQAVCALKIIAEKHDLSEGQIEFLELVNAFVNK